MTRPRDGQNSYAKECSSSTSETTGTLSRNAFRRSWAYFYLQVNRRPGKPPGPHSRCYLLERRAYTLIDLDLELVARLPSHRLCELLGDPDHEGVPDDSQLHPGNARASLGGETARRPTAWPSFLGSSPAS